MSSEPHVPHGAAGPDAPGPRRSLVLSGGGARVSYQAGAVKALLDHGLAFHHMDGTSGGGLNLAMLLSGLSAHEMLERWARLKSWDFLSLRPLKDYVRKEDLTALGSSRGLIEEVLPALGVDFDRIHAATGVEANFNACNFTRKVNVEIPHRQIDPEMLVAGMSLPGMLPPLVRDGDHYLDPAFIQDANLTSGVRAGAEEVWLVWALGNAPDYPGGALQIYIHMLEMSAQGGLRFHLDEIRRVNAEIAQGRSPHGQTRPVRLHVICPEHPLPLDPDLYTGRIDHATLLTMGYRDARRYLDAMKPQGVPLDPDVTRMAPRAPGILFKETMEGGFALGVSDPEEGREAGESAGTELAMHATVTIDDMDRFVSSEDHPGGLAGTLDFPPLGEGIPAYTGVFQLFAPAGEDLKLMVYELGFEAGGETYYLAGRKEVREDSVLELWDQTTTLYTRLHRGPDKDSPVVGAGVLRLGVDDLIRLLSTVRVTGATGVREKSETLATFGKFFLGELWESYGRHVPG